MPRDIDALSVDWSNRRNQLIVLQSMQNSLSDKTKAIVTDFDTFMETAPFKFAAYLKEVTTVGTKLAEVYPQLYNDEEYEQAVLDVFGPEKDVDTLLIDGLNISTDNLDVVKPGVWVANMYRILVDLGAEINTINDFLSYLQYGLTTWDTARRNTYPEQYPTLDGIPDPLRTPDKNMIYDWHEQDANPLATVRGMIVYEDLGDVAQSVPVLYGAVTIGEGSTTSVTTVALPSADVGAQLFTGALSVYDTQSDSWIDFKFQDTFDIYIPVLTQRKVLGGDDVIAYEAFLRIDHDTGAIYVTALQPGATSVDLINHVTYPIVSRGEDCSLMTGENDRNIYQNRYTYDTSSTLIGSCSIENKGARQQHIVAPLLHPDKTQWAVIEDDVTGVSLNLNLDGVSFFTRAVESLAIFDQTGQHPVLYPNRRWHIEKDPTPPTTLDILIYYYLAGATTPSEYIQYEGNLLIRRTYSIAGSSSVIIGALAEDPASISEFVNFDGQFITLALLRTGVTLRLEKATGNFILYNSNVGATVIPANTETPIQIQFAADSPLSFQPDDIQDNVHGFVKLTLKDAFASSNLLPAKRKLGMIISRDWMPFDVADPDDKWSDTAAWFARQEDVSNTVLAYTLVPRSTNSPQYSIANRYFFFNIYRTEKNIAIYEFVLRDPTELKPGVTPIASQTVIPREYYPGQHLAIQLGDSSYVLLYGDGGAALHMTEQDIEKLQNCAMNRFYTFYPCIPLMRGLSITPVTPSVLPPVTTPPVITGGLKADPKDADVYYEWSNMPAGKMRRTGRLGSSSTVWDNNPAMAPMFNDLRTTPVGLRLRQQFQSPHSVKGDMVAPNENDLILNAAYDIRNTSDIIWRVSWETDAKKDRKREAVTTDAMLDQMSRELMQNGVDIPPVNPDDDPTPNPVIYMILSDDTVLQAQLVVIDVMNVVDTNPTASSPGVQRTVKTGARMSFIVARYDWAKPIAEGLQLETARAKENLDSIITGWDHISKLDYFMGVKKHATLFGQHFKSISALCQRFTDYMKETGMQPGEAPGLFQRATDSIYSAWNSIRYRNI